jgi:hypothetical protein
MASNRLEECLQAVAGRENTRAIEGRRRIRWAPCGHNGPNSRFRP